MLLALDPGISGCGVAVFKDRALARAEYVKNTLPSSADDLERCAAMGAAVASWYAIARRGVTPDANPLELVAEWPRVYSAGKAKRGADPNDLLLLSAVDAAAAVALGCRARLVYPRDHKGTMGEMPDGSYLVETRVREALSPAELARVTLPGAASLGHNVIDAISVGLHACGRSLVSDRERVIAR